jgi:uncharacterized repeat protein (TIGR02543 family)
LNTNDNRLEISGALGDVWKVSCANVDAYHYGDWSQRWWTPSYTRLGQFVHVSYNGGSGTDSTSEIDSTTFTAPSAPTRSGYTFNGWTYNGSTYAPGASITLSAGALDLTASWTAVTTYTVAFNSNGGSTVASQSVASGSTASRPTDPTKAHYTFANWYTESALTNVYNFSTAVTANLTLYAKWTAETYTITEYAVIGGAANSLATETATYGVSFTPATFAPSGMTISGWYTDEACTTAYSVTTWTAAGNLYAKCVAASGSTFTLNLGTYLASCPDSSDCYTDNWSSAYRVYVYAWNASYHTGLMSMGNRGTSGDYGNFAMTLSTTWTSVIFCLDSSFPSAANLWRKTGDITLPTHAANSSVFYSMVGRTSLTSASTPPRVSPATLRLIPARPKPWSISAIALRLRLLELWRSAAGLRQTLQPNLILLMERRLRLRPTPFIRSPFIPAITLLRSKPAKATLRIPCGFRRGLTNILLEPSTGPIPLLSP